MNAFTTLIFYSMGYNLFTLRQAARRSWRINQTAPRVEVYMLYYVDTMQAKAMKLMASKLAVAGIIEGNLSEEGLAAMSDVKDLTSQMAKELALGIKDNVEDIAATFKKMAIINPHRERVQPAALPVVAAVRRRPLWKKRPLLLPHQFKSRTVDAENKQALYDGLLQRTLEERRKRSRRRSRWTKTSCLSSILLRRRRNFFEHYHESGRTAARCQACVSGRPGKLAFGGAERCAPGGERRQQVAGPHRH